MRVAVVSPYSWSYPGGVNRHVESLSQALAERGHDVAIMAPFDPPDRITRLTHSSEPRITALPDHVCDLGRTIGIGMNGSISNLSTFPEGVSALRRSLSAFAPQVVHVHEPVAPVIGWDACSWRGAPVVGTFHAYSTRPWPNHAATAIGARRKFNQLHERIAVSKAARWTGERWFGGEYEVIPNGVELQSPPAGPAPASHELRVLFVGRAEERKGLPVLLGAFEALIEHVPARLTVVGPTQDDVARHLNDPAAARRIDAVGRVGHDELWRRLRAADVLCAPSLSGESFGMILTEAFAAGTPVIASAIAGYAEVVSDGVDGVLVPPGEPQRLAEELQALYYEPERGCAMGEAARESARRYAWPEVAARVESVYERAVKAFALGESRKTRHMHGNSYPRHGAIAAACRKVGFAPIDGSPRRPAAKMPPPAKEPPPYGGHGRAARRAGLALAGLAGAGLTYLAASRIGFDNVVESIVRSDLSWVVAATAVMIASLFLRAESWFAIARSALPNALLRRRDVTSATMIGVLMSATLPARLGEPARGLVLARRIGRMRETFPVLLGTLVSQTVLNLVALAILGAIIIGSTDLFAERTEQLFLISAAPILILVAVLFVPVLARGTGSGLVARGVAIMRGALVKVRSGLVVFRDPRNGPVAAMAQLGAWALQLFSCLVLFSALGLDDQPGIGIGAAAAVLFAVNVTAVVPATPSNVGVFQLAVISVLTTGFGVSAADALAYGVILQAVEIATAVALGLPALVREGVTWSDMRMRALQSAPVRLTPRIEPGATESPR